MAQLHQRFGGRQIAALVEQSRGASLHADALMDYDFVVIYPLHPAMVAKFREAFKSSGVKSEPLGTERRGLLWLDFDRGPILRGFGKFSDPVVENGDLVQNMLSPSSAS